jgi:hypothetical protein
MSITCLSMLFLSMTNMNVRANNTAPITGIAFGTFLNKLPNESIPTQSFFTLTGDMTDKGYAYPSSTDRVMVRVSGGQYFITCVPINGFLNGFWNGGQFRCPNLPSATTNGYIPLDFRWGTIGRIQSTGKRIAVGRADPNTPNLNSINGPITDLGKFLVCNEGDLNLPADTNISCSGELDSTYIAPTRAISVGFNSSDGISAPCTFFGPQLKSVTCENIYVGSELGTKKLGIFHGDNYYHLMQQTSYNIFY